MASKKTRIGGVSSRFGVGILYGSRISFATRLKNGEIAVFSQDISSRSALYRIPFLRSLMVFRQLFLVFFLARKNLVRLSKDGLVDLQRGRRLIGTLLFVALYITASYFVLPLIDNLTPLLRAVIFILLLMVLIRLFFSLVLGDQSLKYHGAEHKVINTFLAGDSLTLPAALRSSRFAFRCGTTLATFFILLELLIPDTAYQFLVDHLGSTLGVCIFFFLILGLAYELLSIFSRKKSGTWLRFFAAPVSKMQLLTTREPSVKELEVALSAIRAAVGWWPQPDGDELI